MNRQLVDMVTPNRAVGLMICAPLFYLTLAWWVPPIILRDTFNILSWCTYALVAVTWGRAAFASIKEGAKTGAWMLILAVFLLSMVVISSRTYSIVFNMMGRPDSWALGALAGFWPYSYMIVAFLLLASPGVSEEGELEPRTVWWIIAAAGLGCGASGFVLGASIGTTI